MSALVPNELILLPSVLEIIPLSPKTIWRLEQHGKFPRRISIAPKRVAWRRSEIEAWIAERAAARTPAGIDTQPPRRRGRRPHVKQAETA
jgi:prophage regulatory protein